MHTCYRTHTHGGAQGVHWSESEKLLKCFPSSSSSSSRSAGHTAPCWMRSCTTATQSVERERREKPSEAIRIHSITTSGVDRAEPLHQVSQLEVPHRARHSRSTARLRPGAEERLCRGAAAPERRQLKSTQALRIQCIQLTLRHAGQQPLHSCTRVVGSRLVERGVPSAVGLGPIPACIQHVQDQQRSVAPHGRPVTSIAAKRVGQVPAACVGGFKPVADVHMAAPCGKMQRCRPVKGAPSRVCACSNQQLNALQLPVPGGPVKRRATFGTGRLDSSAALQQQLHAGDAAPASSPMQRPAAMRILLL